MQKIFVPPTNGLKELNNLFIELTQKNCNQRCKECYIDFPITRNIKDFIQIDKIKEALNDTKNENLNCIYLTGAEPMTHPDFNSILRLCLKRTNVCIMTNASFINEKKSRFLKKVEDESQYRIITKLSFASYDEEKNDNVRFKGAFRQNIFALKCLEKYGFVSVICINNFYNEDKNQIMSKFQEILKNNSIQNAIIQITEWAKKENSIAEIDKEMPCLDCSNGRILTSSGVYACPFLSNDYRGRVGSDFKDHQKDVRLETSFCSTCLKNKNPMFSIKIEA